MHGFAARGASASTVVSWGNATAATASTTSTTATNCE